MGAAGISIMEIIALTQAESVKGAHSQSLYNCEVLLVLHISEENGRPWKLSDVWKGSGYTMQG